MRRKILLLMFQGLSHNVFAQAYYMHEAYEDSDGAPFSGILGMIVLFGVIWIIGKCIENYSEVKKEWQEDQEKKRMEIASMENRLNANPNKYKYQNNQYWREGYLKAKRQISKSSSIEPLYNKTINDLIRDYISLPSYSEQAKEIMRRIGYYQYLEWNNEGLVKEGRKPIRIINTQCHHLDDTEFEKECIRIYGDYVELLTFCLIVFEDGEFRIIPYKDRRFDPLKKYVLDKYPTRVNIANKLTNSKEFLDTFIAWNLKTLPQAKDMENHGIIAPNFLGSCYFALMAYNGDTPKEAGLRYESDFIIYIGMETAIYLHKMLKRPLSPHSYYDLKKMEKLNLSAEEYIDYKKNINWARSPNEIHDKYLGFLGRNREEASKTMAQKLGFSFEDAKNELKDMKWHI